MSIDMTADGDVLPNGRPLPLGGLLPAVPAQPEQATSHTQPDSLPAEDPADSSTRSTTANVDPDLAPSPNADLDADASPNPGPDPGLGASLASADQESAHSEVFPDSTHQLQTVRRRLLPKWTGWLLLALGLLTLPWIGGLAVELPSRSEAAHYDISWTGFDVLLCVLLLRTGWSALHDLEHVELTAAMTGVLLIVDAWFDVMSAPDTRQFLVALAMAVCVELPLAGFCLWIAGRVETERRRRSEVLTALVRRFENRRKQAASRRALRIRQRSHTPSR